MLGLTTIEQKYNALRKGVPTTLTIVFLSIRCTCLSALDKSFFMSVVFPTPGNPQNSMTLHFTKLI